jgi:hypothetical protein
MTPTFTPDGLRKVRWWEYALRFAFGGIVTACTGLIAHRYGPVAGGFFLAFPAILPASLTLVQQHDGRAKAVDDARGARLGSLGLAAFAAVGWLGAAWPPPVVLGLATLAWVAVSVAAWTVTFGRAPGRESARPLPTSIRAAAPRRSR